MELERTKQQRMDLQRLIDRSIAHAQNRGITSDEAIKLIKDDIEYGLTEEQIVLYEKKFPKEPDKMAVFSKCLRAGYSEEAIEVITDTRLNAHQMEVAYDFYEKRVSLDAIRDIVFKNMPAKRMRELLKEMLMEIEAKNEDMEVAPEYVKELFKEMKESLMALKADNNKYEALSKKLDEIVVYKKELHIQNNLINQMKKEIMEKDSVIAGKDAEIKKLKGEVSDVNVSTKETDVDVKATDKKEEAVIKDNRIPVYYQMQVVDRGIITDRMLIDRSERKISGFNAIISRLCSKRKSRQDIVRLVSSGDLNAEQLEQIYVGMESGLTEEQLEQLINNNLTPDRMAKIILIAKSDNQRRQMN